MIIFWGFFYKTAEKKLLTRNPGMCYNGINKFEERMTIMAVCTANQYFTYFCFPGFYFAPVFFAVQKNESMPMGS